MSIKDNVTLGEVKARCAELTGKYGDQCCNHCEFGDIGCCDPPDAWKLEETNAAHPERDADDEIRRLRTIVGAVETMLGRKFDV